MKSFVIKWRYRLKNMPLKILECLGLIDFDAILSQKEIGISEEDGNEYNSTSPYLINLLKKLNISQKDNILDMGCGKGKALYYMSRFKFHRIRGIDLSQNLLDIAVNNFRVLRVRKNIELQLCNAVEYYDYNDFNYIFLFNPFPYEIMKIVLHNIKDSINSKSGDIIIIYQNPVCHKLFTELGFELFLKYEPRGRAPFFCYRISSQILG